MSQWGHDFRPDYRELTVLHERFPHVPRIALTATADAPTRREIVERLRSRPGPRHFVCRLRPPQHPLPRSCRSCSPSAQLLDFLAASRPASSGIVYCLSRAQGRRHRGGPGRGRASRALPYHAGLDAEVRAANQDRFMHEEGVIMVATIAFGMGIDKPDVRFVAHLDLPQDRWRPITRRPAAPAATACRPRRWHALRPATMSAAARRLMRAVRGRERPRSGMRAPEAGCAARLLRVHALPPRRCCWAISARTRAEACGHCDVCLEPPESFDGTEPAQKALSAVYRTGQRFGAGHLIDVLRGETPTSASSGSATTGCRPSASAATRPRRLALGPAAAGGAGADRDRRRGAWRDRPGRRLPGRAQGRAAGGAAPRPGAGAAGGQRQGAAPGCHTITDPAAEALFQRLRQWRLETARTQGVPPYVIFHDATLLAIAQARPRSRRALEGLPGLGAAKLERYADGLLAIVGDG